MGSYYFIVNPRRREYLCPGGFGESFKWGGLLTGFNGQSLHSIALAWLVCGNEDGTGIITRDAVGGSWFGDEVYVASDSSPPDLAGMLTATPERPEQNLYSLASREFEDITPPVIAAICGKDEQIARILVARIGPVVEGHSPDSLLNVLGQAAALYSSSEVELALEERFGVSWKEEYVKAKKYWNGTR